jgi:hypothetical protein
MSLRPCRSKRRPNTPDYIAKNSLRAHLSRVKGKEKVTSLAPGAAWTRPDAYIGALARNRRFRRARAERPRTQPVSPQLWLSTIPFAAILAVLAVLAVAIIVAAFPGKQTAAPKPQSAAHERGVAQRGWLQEAQKQFHN